MRCVDVCPLLGIALVACATQVDDFPPSGLTVAGSSGSEPASIAGSSGNIAVAGSNTASGSNSAGGGGGFGTAGTASAAGTLGTGGTGTAGNATGGVSGAGAGGGGSGGEGGKANGGGGSGGKANGGAGVGGKADGGSGGGGAGGKANGGAGGGPNPQCAGVVIPAKNKWIGSAMPVAAGDPVVRAFDGDVATRFSTGIEQKGGEWLQIDFGSSVTIDQVTLHTTGDDYFRHYELRLANTSKDFDVAPLKDDDGKAGDVTVTLPQVKKGQFLTIRQTGKTPDNWWSLYEVNVDCK
jgi:F5/8 type C domain